MFLHLSGILFTGGGSGTGGARHPPCAVHAGRYGQQAGGTHPTGMHTCSNIILKTAGRKTLHLKDPWTLKRFLFAKVSSLTKGSL